MGVAWGLVFKIQGHWPPEVGSPRDAVWNAGNVWSSGVHTTLMPDGGMVLSLWECVHVLPNLTVFQQQPGLHNLSVQSLLILVLKKKENSN